jgi:hypothetical protein
MKKNTREAFDLLDDMATHHSVRQSNKGGRHEVDEITKLNAKIDALQNQLRQRGVAATVTSSCEFCGDTGHPATDCPHCIDGGDSNE